MDTDNDKLKKLFSEGEADLPLAFGWEQMEEGIREKMAALEATRPPSRRSHRKVFLIIAVLLLCLVPVLLFNSGWLRQMTGKPIEGNASDDQVETADQVVNHSDLASFPLSGSDQSARALPQGSEPSAGASGPAVPDQSGFNAEGEASGNVNGKPAGKYSSAAPYSPDGDASVPLRPSASDRRPAASPPAAPEASERSLPAGLPLKSAAPGPMAVEEKAQVQSRWGSLPALPARAQSVQRTAERSIAQPFVAQQPAHLPRRIPTHQWAMVSGVSGWTEGYGGTLPEHAPYEQPALSYYTQLSYTRRLGNNFTLTAGLQYQQLETQFAWSQRIKDYTTATIKDTIVLIQVSALTGNRTEVIGDVEVSVDAVRNVRHHNQYRQIQVPVALGKSWLIGNRWQAGLAAGSAIQVLAHNQGRGVYQGELEYLDGPATRQMDNRWGIHGLAMARLGFRLSGRTGILMDVQYQQSLTNWSIVPNQSMCPRIVHLGLGVYHTL